MPPGGRSRLSNPAARVEATRSAGRPREKRLVEVSIDLRAWRAGRALHNRAQGRRRARPKAAAASATSRAGRPRPFGRDRGRPDGRWPPARAGRDNGGHRPHDAGATPERRRMSITTLAPGPPTSQTLRDELQTEHDNRRRAECMADDSDRRRAAGARPAGARARRRRLLPRVHGRVVDDTESHGCGVWLLNDDGSSCELWMAIRPAAGSTRRRRRSGRRSRCRARAWRRTSTPTSPGWTETIEYSGDDARLPAHVHEFNREHGDRVADRRAAGAAGAARSAGWRWPPRAATRARCMWRAGAARGDGPSGHAGAAPPPGARAEPHRSAPPGRAAGAQPHRPRHPRHAGPGLRGDPHAAAGGAARRRQGAAGGGGDHASTPRSSSPART